MIVERRSSDKLGIDGAVGGAAPRSKGKSRGRKPKNVPGLEGEQKLRRSSRDRPRKRKPDDDGFTTAKKSRAGGEALIMEVDETPGALPE